MNKGYKREKKAEFTWGCGEGEGQREREYGGGGERDWRREMRELCCRTNFTNY